MKLEEAIKYKRQKFGNCRGITVHPDNARPHISLATRQKLFELCWELISHATYSPDV